MTAFMFFSSCGLSGLETIRLVPSANRIGVDRSEIAYGKSFMYSKKRSGPSTDP